MVGILIITHDSLGQSLIQCASHVLGQHPPALEPLGVQAADDPEQVLTGACRLVARLDSGTGVLVLTDLPGATPSNIAARLASQGRVEVIAGVNLPMLLRSITYRDKPLETLVSKAISGGVEGVVHLSKENLRAAG